MTAVALDTNVLVYAHDAADRRRQRRAIDIVGRAVHGGATLPLQVLGEFVSVAGKRLGLSAEDAVGSAADMMAAFTVVAVRPAQFAAAADVHVRHGIPIWDAVLWATVDHAGCAWLLTEDFQDGRMLGGVRFVNPFDPANDDLIDRILPPVASA